MASAIIHICVAKKVNEILKRDEKKFYLGNIAPDISKQIGQTKTKSHFLKKDRVNDIPQIDEFLKKYQNTLKDNDFNLGYYCHLYTDMLWFGIFINDFYGYDHLEVIYSNGERKELNKNTILKLFYNDYSNLNITMIDKYDLDLSLFYEELPKIESNIEEIPIDKLNVIVDKMGLIIEQSKEHNTVILSPESIYRFVEKTSEDFINNLKEIGVI